MKIEIFANTGRKKVLKKYSEYNLFFLEVFNFRVFVISFYRVPKMYFEFKIVMLELVIKASFDNLEKKSGS